VGRVDAYVFRGDLYKVDGKKRRNVAEKSEKFPAKARTSAGDEL